MQPRFAALLFVLGLADLAYVNLGLGHDVFGDPESAGGRVPPGPDEPAPSRATGVIQAARAPNPPPAATAPEPVTERPPPSEVPPSNQAPSLPSTDRPSAAEVPSAAAEVPSAPPPAEPSAAAPSAAAPSAAAPSAAPGPEALALPAPAPPAEPPREGAPLASPPQRPEAPRNETAPAADSVPSSAPRPAQAGLDAPIANADVAPSRSGRASAEPSVPTESAAGLPDAELTVGFPDTASAWLTEPAYAQLMALAAQLRAHPDYRIHIVGHADARGSREFNLDLGSRRARAVTELLARAGVPRRQLEMESRGEDQPLEVGDSEQVWAANRRVEITIGTERNTTP